MIELDNRLKFIRKYVFLTKKGFELTGYCYLIDYSLDNKKKFYKVYNEFKKHYRFFKVIKDSIPYSKEIYEEITDINIKTETNINLTIVFKKKELKKDNKPLITIISL